MNACEICHEKRPIALGLCKNCYQYLRYWNDRPLRDKRSRRKQLELFVKRLDEVTGVRIARHTRKHA